MPLPVAGSSQDWSDARFFILHGVIQTPIETTINERLPASSTTLCPPERARIVMMHRMKPTLKCQPASVSWTHRLPPPSLSPSFPVGAAPHAIAFTRRMATLFR